MEGVLQSTGAGSGRIAGRVLCSMAHLVGLADLEIILGPGKPLGPDVLFLLIHILPVWRPLSGRKTSSFSKLHGDLLLPKASFAALPQLLLVSFPPVPPFSSVPPFPLHSKREARALPSAGRARHYCIWY